MTTILNNNNNNNNNNDNNNNDNNDGNNIINYNNENDNNIISNIENNDGDKLNKTLKEVKLLLWNVWNLPSPLTDGKSKERAKKISPLLTEFDIIILNEAFVNKKELLEHIKDRNIASLGRDWFKFFDSGLLIISSFPIITKSFEYFNKYANWDKFASKGVLCCRIQIGSDINHSIDVFATHMQAGDREADHNSRHIQSIQLAQFINETNKGEFPVILAGDLNMGPSFDDTFKTYSRHYSDVIDAKKRTSDYHLLRNSASLIDVIGKHKKATDINRIAYRNAEENSNISIVNTNLEYLNFRDENKKRLSDSDILFCSFSFHINQISQQQINE